MYFDKTVTVFRSTEEGCIKQVVNGVFVDDIKGVSLESKGQAEANSIKVVVPFSSMPEGFEIKESDYICKGEVTAEYATVSEMRKSEPYFIVQSCDKKDYGTVPNYLIIGR